MMLELFGCVVVLLAAIGAAWFTNRVRTGRLSANVTRLGALLCGAGLVAMIVSDFPLAANRFWADHSVLAAMLSSALLVGAVYLAYEYRELERQAELARGLSGTGLAGIVDHMVDLELALVLAVSPRPPDELEPDHWSAWSQDGKPLRWLRNGREAILAGDRDPRLRSTPAGTTVEAWAPELVDQAIRRSFAAIRDWGPLIKASEDGTTVLIMLSDIRVALMDLSVDLVPGRDIALSTAAQIEQIRSRARVFAVCFEQWSGARTLRSELLTTHAPLPDRAPSFPRFSKTLDERLDLAAKTLGWENK